MLQNFPLFRLIPPECSLKTKIFSMFCIYFIHLHTLAHTYALALQQQVEIMFLSVFYFAWFCFSVNFCFCSEFEAQVKYSKERERAKNVGGLVRNVLVFGTYNLLV